MLPSNQRQIIEQAKFAYSLLEKAFGKKKTERQVGSIEYLNLSNKKLEWKQIECIFPQNFMNDLICPKLNEIVKLQDIT